MNFDFIHDKARCVFCGACAAVCPVRALVLRNETTLDFDAKLCTGCQACAQVCPMDACEVQKEAAR